MYMIYDVDTAVVQQQLFDKINGSERLEIIITPTLFCCNILKSVRMHFKVLFN